MYGTSFRDTPHEGGLAKVCDAYAELQGPKAQGWEEGMNEMKEDQPLKRLWRRPHRQ